MIVKKIDDIPAFIAGDQTILREVLHPKNDPVDLPYSVAHARIDPGQMSLPHALQSGELYLFLRGEGRIFVGDQKQEIAAGDMVYVPPGVRQYVENTGFAALVFYCIVAPEWKAEEEEIF